MDLVKYIPSHLTNGDVVLWYHIVDNRRQASDAEAQNKLQECAGRHNRWYATERQTNVGATDTNRNTRNDNSETVHEESGMTDTTISSRKDTGPLPEQQTSTAVLMSATDVTFPTPNANQDVDHCVARQRQLSEAKWRPCRKRSWTHIA
jgi:hypothetical protein